MATLIESPHRWRALRDEFERWRQVYRKAYLQDHASRQGRARELRGRIERTARRVVQLDRFERIEALRDGVRDRPPGDFPAR